MRSLVLLSPILVVITTSPVGAQVVPPYDECGFAVAREVAGLNKFFVDENRDGDADVAFAFGPADADAILVGDWDGTGDNIAIRRTVAGLGKFFFNTDADGRDEFSYVFGEPDLPVLVGDWNGDGQDTVAIRREFGAFVKFFFDDGFGNVANAFGFGDANDIPVVGDWDGDGDDNLGVVRDVDGYLQWNLNFEAGAPAEEVFLFGRVGDQVIVGDWDGDGRSDPGYIYTNPHPNSDLYSVAFNVEHIPDPVGIVWIIRLRGTRGAPIVCDWDRDGLDDIGEIQKPVGQMRFVTTTDRYRFEADASIRFGFDTDEGLIGFFEGLAPD